MSNFNMPPRLKASDYAKGKITQDEIISLQIANDANISKARQALKLNEIAPINPQQSLSPDELLADSASQEASARTNLEKLGFRPQEASQIISSIRLDADLDFTQLNANFPALEADIKKRFNPRLLTPTFFLEYFRKYSEEVGGAVGMRVFNPNNGGNNGLINSIAELRAIIPDPAVIGFIRRRAGESRIVGAEILGELNRLQNLLPSVAELEALSRMNAVQQQRIIDDLLAQFSDMPSSAEIRRLATLIQEDQMTKMEFYEAIVSIVDSIPQGNQSNIISPSPVIMMPPRGISSSSSSSSSRRSIVTPTINLEEPEELGDSPEQISAKAKETRDYKAAQTAVDTGGDPRRLSANQQAIYASLTGVKRIAPSISDLTEATSTQSLGSSTAIDASTIGQIKSTFRAHPELAGQLVNITTGAKVNYNDLQKTIPAKSSSKKVYVYDTNILELFRTKFGTGMKAKMGNRRIIMGKGLAVKETPSYREYGKYAIHIPQLEQQDVLNVKYKSLGQVPKFKPLPVSDVFRDFILDLLDNGKPNPRVYTQIAPEERKFFEEMSIGAGVWNGLGLKRTTTSTDEEENKRFELLKGEYMAGNNNPRVITELRRLVVKMMNDGRIRKNQGVELLMELS